MDFVQETLIRWKLDDLIYFFCCKYILKYYNSIRIRGYGVF